MKKVAISWIVCVLALVGLMAWLGGDLVAHHNKQSDGEPIVKADFTLQNAAGETVTQKNFRGKYLLVYFGFTHCPDICPTTLLLMANVLDQMGDAGAKVQPMFITVDPERDTPKAVGDYVTHFGKGFVGLSGTPEQIKHVADSFKVFYSKVEDKDSALGYSVDHSGFVYLMGPNGEYLTHFPATVSEQELKKELLTHVR